MVSLSNPCRQPKFFFKSVAFFLLPPFLFTQTLQAAPINQITLFIAGDHSVGNHYIIITKVTDTEVTYIDPGAGPETALEQLTITKEQFLQAWVNPVSDIQNLSAGFGYVMSSRPPPAQVESTQHAVLSTQHEMQVRGAFFGFIAAIFIGLAIAAVAAAAVYAIVTNIDHLVNLITNILTSFGDFFVGLFTGDFTKAFRGILDFVVGNFELGMFIFTSPILGAFQIAEAIGIPVEITSTIFDGINIAVGIGLTLGPGTQALGLAMIAQGTAGILNRHTDLPPTLTNLISLAAAAAGAFVGGGFSGGSIDAALSSFKSALPFLIDDFASAGFVAVGDLLGLDPRLTSAAGSFVGGFIGATLGKDTGGNGTIYDGTCPESNPACNPTDPNGDGNPTNDGWFAWFNYIVEAGKNLLNQQNPNPDPGNPPPPPGDDETPEITEVSSSPRVLQNMEVELTESVERQLEEKYDVEGVFQETRQALGKLVPTEGDINAMPNYGQYIQQNGIANALDQHAPSFFRQSSIEKMVSGSPNGTVKGFVNDQITNGGVSDVVDSSGRNLKRLTLDTDLIVEYDPNTFDIVNIREGNFGINYQDLRYNGSLNQPSLVNGEIIRLNPANGVRVQTSVMNGQITQISFLDAQGELARMTPVNGKSFITRQDNLFLDYKLQEFDPSAEFKVESGLVKDVRYTVVQNLDINGQNVNIDILLEKLNEGNPILRAIAHNLEQLNLQESQIETVLRVIADHFEDKLKKNGNIWRDENGQFRLYGLSDVFDFDIDRVTKQEIIQQLDIPADRILNAQDDLVDYANQLIETDAKRIAAEQDINEIRSRLENQNLPAILETGRIEFSAITPSGDKVFETSVSSGVIFRGNGAHTVPGTNQTAQAEMFIDKNGTVYYSDTALNSKGTFYPRKDFLLPGSTPENPLVVADKDVYQNGQLFEINATKVITLENGSTMEIPEKIRIEVANVFGSDDMAVIVRKESGNFYTESTTKITPVDPSTGDEEFEQALRGKDILEALIDSVVNFGQSILDVHNLLRNFWI